MPTAFKKKGFTTRVVKNRNRCPEVVEFSSLEASKDRLDTLTLDLAKSRGLERMASQPTYTILWFKKK